MHQSQQDEIGAIADWIIDQCRRIGGKREPRRLVSEERHDEQALRRAEGAS